MFARSLKEAKEAIKENALALGSAVKGSAVDNAVALGSAVKSSAVAAKDNAVALGSAVKSSAAAAKDNALALGSAVKSSAAAAKDYVVTSSINQSKKALLTFGSISGYDQDERWIMVQDVVELFKSKDINGFFEKYNNKPEVILRFVHIIIRIVQYASTYTLSQLLQLIYEKVEDLPTKYRKVIIVTTTIIKGLEYNESKKYSELFNEIDGGVEPNTFWGMLSEDQAAMKNLFFGFKDYFIESKLSKEKDEFLESITSQINPQETYNILHAILQIVIFLKDSEPTFYLPDVPCAMPFADVDMMKPRIDEVTECLRKEKKESTDRVYEFVILLLQSALNGIEKNESSNYLLPIFLITVVHHITGDLRRWDFTDELVKKDYPGASEAEVEQMVRGYVTMFNKKPVKVDEKKKGGVLTRRRRHLKWTQRRKNKNKRTRRHF